MSHLWQGHVVTHYLSTGAKFMKNFYSMEPCDYNYILINLQGKNLDQRTMTEEFILRERPVTKFSNKCLLAYFCYFTYMYM